MFEPLENRRLFSNGIGAGAGPEIGPAAFSWDPATATLTVTNVSSAQINDYADEASPIVEGDVYFIDKSVIPAQTSIFHGVQNLIVVGTRAKDFISASFYSGINASIDGALGADHLTVANNGLAQVVIHGGNGNDSIFADNNGAGSVTAYGDGGRDTFDSINGGAVFIQ
jgi:hypothetical protein